MSLDFPSRHQPTSFSITHFLQGLKKEELKCYIPIKPNALISGYISLLGTYIPHATPPTLTLPPTP